ARPSPITSRELRAELGIWDIWIHATLGWIAEIRITTSAIAWWFRRFMKRHGSSNRVAGLICCLVAIPLRASSPRVPELRLASSTAQILRTREVDTGGRDTFPAHRSLVIRRELQSALAWTASTCSICRQRILRYSIRQSGSRTLVHIP